MCVRFVSSECARMLTHAGKLWWDCMCLFLLGLTVVGKRGLLHEHNHGAPFCGAAACQAGTTASQALLDVIRKMKCTCLLDEVGWDCQLAPT